jgi:Tfp pilus assembly protein PilO
MLLLLGKGEAMILFIGGMILFIVGILAGYLFCCLDFLSRYDELKQENKFLKEELKKKYMNTR